MSLGLGGMWTVCWPQPRLLAGFCVVSGTRLTFSIQWLTFRRVLYFWEFDRKFEMDNPPSKFTVNAMQCISIDWYPEPNVFMLYTAVNAPRSHQKASNWSGIKNGKSPKEIRLSRYQPIDKKHFWVCVKFEVGLSILFTKKNESKKVRLFLVLSFKWRDLKN
jgi:hypothetical protein